MALLVSDTQLPAPTLPTAAAVLLLLCRGASSRLRTHGKSSRPSEQSRVEQGEKSRFHVQVPCIML